MQAGSEHLQDALVILCSSLFYGAQAGYAFLFDNSYDLLVCAGLAVLNASQLIVLWVSTSAYPGA